MQKRQIRRCTAVLQTGGRCPRNPIAGGTVCSIHGGSVGSTIAAARQRLLAAVDSISADMVAIARDKRAPYNVRVNAGIALMDRAGLSPKNVVQLSGPNDGPIKIDFSKFSDEELSVLEAAALKAQPSTPPTEPGSGSSSA